MLFNELLSHDPKTLQGHISTINFNMQDYVPVSVADSRSWFPWAEGFLPVPRKQQIFPPPQSVSPLSDLDPVDLFSHSDFDPVCKLCHSDLDLVCLLPYSDPGLLWLSCHSDLDPVWGLFHFDLEPGLQQIVLSTQFLLKKIMNFWFADDLKCLLFKACHKIWLLWKTLQTPFKFRSTLCESTRCQKGLGQLSTTHLGWEPTWIQPSM